MLHWHRFARNRTPAVSHSVQPGTYEHYVTSGTATCTLQYSSNGTCSVSSGVSPVPGNWMTGSTNGAAYDISFDGGGSWLNLGTARNISATKSVGTGTTTNGPIDVRIRNASTLVQVAAGSVTLLATRDTA